ncbi:MAG: malonate decarboxylase acyl carrier protein [Lachnospiraceae bacterium]
MSLQTLEFTFKAPEGYKTLPENWLHSGVVSSGDMEVLMNREALGGYVKFTVKTPVKGFDDVWEKILSRFVTESKLGDVVYEINDNNATPYIVLTRLRQAVLEAEGGEA